VFEPLVRGVSLTQRTVAIATGMGHEVGLAALLATVTMTAHGRRAASQQCAQNLPVMRGQLGRDYSQTEA